MSFLSRFRSVLSGQNENAKEPPKGNPNNPYARNCNNLAHSTPAPAKPAESGTAAGESQDANSRRLRSNSADSVRAARDISSSSYNASNTTNPYARNSNRAASVFDPDDDDLERKTSHFIAQLPIVLLSKYLKKNNYHDLLLQLPGPETQALAKKYETSNLRLASPEEMAKFVDSNTREFKKVIVEHILRDCREQYRKALPQLFPGEGDVLTDVKTFEEFYLAVCRSSRFPVDPAEREKLRRCVDEAVDPMAAEEREKWRQKAVNFEWFRVGWSGQPRLDSYLVAVDEWGGNDSILLHADPQIGLWETDAPVAYNLVGTSYIRMALEGVELIGTYKGEKRRFLDGLNEQGDGLRWSRLHLVSLLRLARLRSGEFRTDPRILTAESWMTLNAMTVMELESGLAKQLHDMAAVFEGIGPATDYLDAGMRVFVKIEHMPESVDRVRAIRAFPLREQLAYFSLCAQLTRHVMEGWEKIAHCVVMTYMDLEKLEESLFELFHSLLDWENNTIGLQNLLEHWSKQDSTFFQSIVSSFEESLG